MSKKLPNQKVLIIDDDHIAQMLIKRHLEIAGFHGEIIMVENGQQGFEVLQSSSDKITTILDYQMPVLDGIGLLRKMKNHDISHPVFMLTSSILPSHKTECLEHAVVKEYFVKPIDQDKTKIILDYTRSV